MLRTEHPFTLPKGYVDRDGNLHREGVMRLATAMDEIAPLRDERVARNGAYLAVILLSRVITQLGGISPVTPATIESLFAADLEYLQRLYNELNYGEDGRLGVTCPACAHEFEVERPGGS